ncbi:MAG TPA: sigma-70 family RNA polymerase sigma factor [Acidimicrobiales bacterium]|nr:sigma-70 family RNA polymerase sigma factor [Acidimicrobiales bacterium]
MGSRPPPVSLIVGNDGAVTDVTDATFEDFVARAEPRLRRVLVAHHGPDVGVDLCAEVMAWAWENRARLDHLDNPVGYLYRVAQSRSRRYHRWRQRTPSVAVPPERLPDGDEHRETILTLLALDTLTPPQRVAVLLVKAHGWTYPEVAEVLGVPTTTVTNHVTRGLARLRAHLGEPS